jgi:hypothetical protein
LLVATCATVTYRSRQRRDLLELLAAEGEPATQLGVEVRLQLEIDRTVEQ